MAANDNKLVESKTLPHRWGYLEGAAIIPFSLLMVLGTASDLLKTHQHSWSRSFVLLYFLALLSSLTGCGSGSSGGQTSPPSQITSVSVSPTTANVLLGATQLFTATVQGTGAFSPNVTWSVSGIVGGNSTHGTITADGLYTAPAAVPNPSNVTVTATSVQDPTKLGNSTATILVPVVLNSITPSSASAGEVLTVDATFNINVIETPQMVFSGANGTSVSMSCQTATGLTVVVPFGATSGPVSMSIPPQPGSGASVVTSNSVPFTRLPNLLIHAPNKDLSSGETLQFQYRLLGANTPNVVAWTSDSGNITSSGLFTAPTVSGESYSHVTGCLQGTNSCDVVLLRILPFRITPSDPMVSLGNTLQFDAVEGGSTLSPTWSVLAGGGTINSAGLYTAPTTTAGAGGVPVQAQNGSTTEQAEVAVTGAFPGLVNRVYDYANFNIPQPPEARFVKSVAVSGNRAFTLSIGNAFKLATTYEALNVYDITNPDQPLWIDAGEAASNAPANLFTYGNTLFSIDSEDLVVYSLMTQVPTLTQVIPLTGPWQSSLNNGIFYLDYNNLGMSGSAPLPVDVYDMTTGTAIHTHYDLPVPVSGAGEVWGVSGNGNTIYISWFEDISNTPTYTVATYDVSQSPPTLLSTISTTSTTEYHLQVVGNLLFADSVVYDISNVVPVQVATVPTPLLYVWGTQGNNVLATGGGLSYGASANYVVINTSSPSAPVVHANVVDLPTSNIFNPLSAAWANSNTFYTADGTGGIAVYDVSAAGGPATATAQEIFSYTYAQALNGQTLYSASQYAAAADLAVLDVSGGTPVLEGSLYYDNNSPSAVQASGTTVFFGLSNYLKVIDASNPAAPVEIGSVAVPVSALALLGSDLFVSTTDGRLIVYDVTTPASPNQLASVSMPVASTMSISGSLLLVAAGHSGLLVYDISNPSAPAKKSHYLPGTAPVWDAVATVNGVVILAADSDGIIILDLANPLSPQVLNEQQLPFLNPFPAPSTGAGILTAFSLAYQNGLSYVGTGNAGIIFVYDTSVPADPRLMGLNVVSPYGLDIVSVITPGQNNLYSAVIDELIQLDNTIPQNSIELYFPPAALSNATTITPGDLRTAKTRRDIISAIAKRMFTNRNRSGAAGRGQRL